MPLPRTLTMPESGSAATSAARSRRPGHTHDPALHAARHGRVVDGRSALPTDAARRDRGPARGRAARPGAVRLDRGGRGQSTHRRRAHRRARADDRSRRHRLRQPGCRERGTERPLHPLRTYFERRRRYGPRTPMPGRGEPAPDSNGRAHRHARGQGARARRDAHDGPHSLRPRRADHLRAQACLVGVRAPPRSRSPAPGRR